jgi:hypothetical protein
VTDEERKREGADEEIEDLEAPAADQDDVAGGAAAGCTCDRSHTCETKMTGRACDSGHPNTAVRL